MESITVDEIIIQFVQKQKCLYDKTDKNFKDSQKKKDVWTKISENLRNIYCVDMSAEAVEKERCSSLRNQFSRENRRKLLPSGSGYEPVKEWNLYKHMQFLTPYVAHRRTKTSLPFVNKNISLQTSITQENLSLSRDNFNSSSPPLIINDHDYQNIGSVEGNKLSSYLGKGSIISNVNCDMIDRPASTASSCSSNSSLQFWAPSTSSDHTSFNSPATFKPIQKIVPELDHFAKHRKYKNEQIEQDLEKSTRSISTALKSVQNIMLNKNSGSTSGYMLVLEDRLKHVTDKNKTQCLIELLQIIQKYKERQ